jgi:hypothetical protein
MKVRSVLLWTCAETGGGRVRGFINAASDARGGVVPVVTKH